MQQFLATILHVFLTFLEASFQRKDETQLPGTQKKEEDDDDDDDNIYNHHQKDQNAKKKATEDAYKFLELEPPCELEHVRKKYKQLSLRHHPDRNGGSQQSHQMMQKLNACFKLIEEDILGYVIAEAKEEEEAEPQFNYKEFMKQQREAKEQMEREIRQEQERYQQMKREFDQNKEKDKTHCHQQQRDMDLQSEQGRQQAQAEFWEKVNKQKQQKEKQQKEKEKQNKEETKTASTSTTPTPTTQSPEKPKNPVMDYNLNELVVALRLKMPDIALGLMEEHINKHVQSRALDAQFTGERMTLKQLGMEYLLKPLDLDHNTLLHYAVYYEIYQVVNAVCGIAHHKFNSLEAVLYAKNQYGQTPWTYAEIAQDESIRNLIQSQLDLVTQIRKQTRLFPAIRSGCVRLFQIMTHLDILATLTLGLSFLLGYKIFQIHYSLAMSMALWVQYLRVIFIAEKCMYNSQLGRQQIELEQDNVDVSLLISCYSIWITICQLLIWIYPYVMIELIALMLPFLVAILMSRSRRHKQSGIFAVPWMIFSLSSLFERVLHPIHSIVVSKLAVLVQYNLVKPVLLVVAGTMTYGVKTGVVALTQ